MPELTVKPGFVVPYRSDGGRRDVLWDHCEQWWNTYLPNYPVYVGVHDDGGLFNRSAAINAAVKDAREDGCNVYVVLDADVLASPDQVVKAVSTAHVSGRMTVGFQRWRGLTREGSDQIVNGYRGSWVPFAATTLRDSVSCLVAVPVRLWDTVGGFDERHVGWGTEDVSFANAAWCLTGEPLRVRGDLWHLWHPKAPGRRETDAERPQTEANAKLGFRYKDLRRNNDKTGMIGLLSEPGGPLHERTENDSTDIDSHGSG